MKKSTGDIKRNDSYLEEVILENEMERTRRLFCEFFPFFVQFFQFGIVCIFFPMQVPDI